MRIEEIADTNISHGTKDEIIMKCTIDHEVSFSSNHIIKILKACASDSMAKVINEIGKNFNRDQWAECYAIDDLDEHGKTFIDDMHYFLHSEDENYNE